MPTTLTNGIQLPDKGSVDWYSSMQSNYNLIDTHLGDTDVHVTAEDKANWNSKQGSLSQDQLDAIAQVATITDDIATLQSGKADASHTHSSSDITDIDDYATKDYVDNSISGLVDNAPDALNTLNELSAALNDDSNFASTVTTALADKANSADLATVATSGSYNDLDDLPTIPTNTSDLTNDSDFVVSSNLATVATSGDYDDLSNKPSIPTKTSDLTNDSNFVDSSSLAAVATSGDYDDLDNKPSIPTNTSDLNNDSGFVTLNDFDIPSKTSDLTNDSGFITSSDVPTSTSDLTNDSNFVDTSNPAVASGITSAKVTDYDTHIADTDIHVTTADKATWNTVTSKATDSDVVHKSGDETISGVKTITDTNLEFKSTSAEYGVSAGDSSVVFKDKNNRQTFKIYNRVFFSGIDNNLVSFFLTQKVNNTYYTSNGIQLFADTGNKDVILRPILANSNADGLSVSLGASDRRWSKIYGTEYYYGSNNVEFSTKFVTTDTNQTISGEKTFSSRPLIYNSNATVQADVPNLVFKNPLVERASTTLDGEQTILFTDKNNSNIASIQAKTYTSGMSDFILTSYSENDGVRTTGIVIRRTPTTSKFHAYSDNITSLGDTNRRWKSVYAMNYYYGNDNIEFSTKFVTTDTNQTISGNKTFSSNVNVYNSDSNTDTANIILKNSKAERGSTTNIGAQNISFVDKNNNQLGNIKCEVDSSGVSTLTLQCTNSSNSSSGLRLRRTDTGTFLLPVYNNGCNLGTSGYRWYDVQTRSINSLEPSSLSLPSDRSARIDISSYITNLGNGDNNQYIVPANGYIWLHFTSINSALCYSQTSGGLTNYAQTFVRYQGDGQLYAFFPVRKNDYFIVQIYTASTAVVQNAFFIPCQGNV